MSSPATPIVVPGVYERAVALSATAFGPIVKATRTFGWAVWLSTAAAAAMSLAPGGGLALGLVLGVLVVFLGCATVLYRDALVRNGLEIVADHLRIEEAVFRRDTGTRRPRTRVGMERWLRENPGVPGRASMLVMLGRFEEADREMERKPPITSDDHFAAVSDALYRIIYTDGTADATELRRAWEALRDPGQRHLRRECLALAEALLAAKTGGEPLAVMAQARPEIGPVQWRSRVYAMVAMNTLFVSALPILILLLRLHYGEA